MPSKESIDFVNRFKKYSPDLQKKVNLSKIRETYPDINVDEFAKRFGIANVASQPTMQAITEEESKINRVSEPEHERLRRPRIEFPENIPRGIKGMAEGAIKLPWMLGKMGLDPTGEFTEAVAKGAYKHFRGYVPVGGVTGGDVLHKMASDPVATAGDLALGGSAVSQILKAFSKVGRTGRVAETAKMAETVGETIKPIVPPTSPRAELPLAPKRIIEPEPRSSWGMKEELPKTQPSDISGQLKPLAPPVGEPKPPLAPPKLGEKESFIDLAYRKIVSEEKNISEGLDRGFRETDLPILKKFNTGEWFDIDELQKSMGKSYANSEMKTSLSRNISKYKDRGLLDVAWDFDGNSYYAAKGTAKPTNLLDSDAVAVANRAIEVGLDLPSAKDVYVRIKKIDKGDDAIAISEALSYVADAQKQGIPLSKHLKNLSGLSDNESGLGSRIRTLYPDLAAKYKPTPISEPKLPLAPPTKAKEAWEAGRVLVPTSEELSQVGAQMSKANLYIKFIGEPFYNKVMDVGRKYIPKPLQRFFLDEYGIPKEFAGMREERLTSARMKTQEAVDWAGERGAMATPEESEAILKAVTDPERTGIAKLKDPKLVEQSQFIADKMSALGDEATELGLIREKSQLFHEGRYLPKIDKMTFADKLKFAKYKMSGRLKQRGEIRTITKDKLAEYESKGWEWFDDITSEGERVGYKVRKFVPFGDVQDPYVLMAKGVADLEHDIAIAKIIKDVATNPEWASAEPIKNFVKLGDYKIDSRMGKISNIRDMYVQPDIARELAEMIRYQRPINQFMSSMLSLWKIGKTAYNPPTHARNLISNAILSDVVGGLSPFRRFDIYASSLRDLATQKGQYFKEFRDAGGMGNTFVNQEINQIFRASEGAKNPIQLFRRITESKFLGAPSRLYQAEEQWFKLANFTFQRQRGLSIAESIAEANKAVFDYSKVSPFVRKARRTIAPFITFPAKAAPRLFEATIKHPLRVGKYILAFKYLTDYSKHKLGLSDEQYAEIKRNLPEEMRSNQWVLMPEKDKNNNLLFFNATYVSPWGELVSGGSMIPLPGGSVAEQIIAPTNPLFRVSAELITNKSIFTKQPIWKTGENWIKKGAMHAAEAALPPTTPLIGRTAEGIRQNLIMQKQNRYGETKSRLRAVGDIVGLRTTSVNMGRQKIFNALNLKKKTDDIRSRITSIGLDKSLSAEEKNNRIKGLIKLQQEYIEEYRGQQ